MRLAQNARYGADFISLGRDGLGRQHIQSFPPMAKMKKQAKRDVFPEVENDEIDEILKSISPTEPPGPPEPITIDKIQDRVISQLEFDIGEAQAQLSSLFRRQERLAFARQKATNKDAVRYVIHRLEEQIMRAESRLKELTEALAKEHRISQYRHEVARIRHELEAIRKRSSALTVEEKSLTEKLMQTLAEFERFTGAPVASGDVPEITDRGHIPMQVHVAPMSQGQASHAA